MSDNLTGNNLRAYFQKYSSEKNKIFLVASTDERVADNIAAFFHNEGGIESCKECIHYYIDHTKSIGVTLTDFVIQLPDIKTILSSIKESKQEVEKIMQRTKERMEN